MTTAMCCRWFSLPFSPEDIWENYIHWVVDGWWDEAERGAFVAPLTTVSLIPATPDTRNMIMGVAWLVEHLRYVGLRPSGTVYKTKTGQADLLHFYACALLNPRTGMCQGYATRHEMCRIYLRCGYQDCDSLWCEAHPSAKLRMEMI